MKLRRKISYKEQAIGESVVSAKGKSKLRKSLDKVFYEDGPTINGQKIPFNLKGFKTSVYTNNYLVATIKRQLGGLGVPPKSPIQSGFYVSLYQGNTLASYSIEVSLSGISTGLVTSFDVPQLGVVWQNAAEQYYFSVPQLQLDTFNLNFIPFTRDYRDTLFYKAYSSLFSSKGTLRLRSKTERYNLLLYYFDEVLYDPQNPNSQESSVVPLIEFIDVRLSHPKLTADLKSNDYATYAVSIAYDHFNILENKSHLSDDSKPVVSPLGFKFETLK